MPHFYTNKNYRLSAMPFETSEIKKGNHNFGLPFYKF